MKEEQRNKEQVNVENENQSNETQPQMNQTIVSKGQENQNAEEQSKESQSEDTYLKETGYYSADINTEEEFTEMLRKLKGNDSVVRLSLNINCILDNFSPMDFQFLPSLQSIDIITLCSLAEKTNYLPWFEQNDYSIEIVWDKDVQIYDNSVKPPLPAYFMNYYYSDKLNFGADDYLEVYNKQIHGNRSYQVFTFLDKKYDYFYNNLGKTTLIIEELSKEKINIKELNAKEYQIIDVHTPEYIDSSYGERNNHKLQFDDLNFDGYEDIYMDIMSSGNKSYKSYYAFLWDERKKQYFQENSFTCFWYNYDSFAIDKENKRIIYGKEMTTSDSHYGIIESQNDEFIETESLLVKVEENNNYITNYQGFVLIYTYIVQGQTKKVLYKKEEEGLKAEEIEKYFPEFLFVKEFQSEG
jgi:hypothetical protein